MTLISTDDPVQLPLGGAFVQPTATEITTAVVNGTTYIYALASDGESNGVGVLTVDEEGDTTFTDYQFHVFLGTPPTGETKYVFPGRNNDNGMDVVTIGGSQFLIAGVEENDPFKGFPGLEIDTADGIGFFEIQNDGSLVETDVLDLDRPGLFAGGVTDPDGETEVFGLLSPGFFSGEELTGINVTFNNGELNGTPALFPEWPLLPTDVFTFGLVTDSASGSSAPDVTYMFTVDTASQNSENEIIAWRFSSADSLQYVTIANTETSDATAPSDMEVLEVDNRSFLVTSDKLGGIQVYSIVDNGVGELPDISNTETLTTQNGSADFATDHIATFQMEGRSFVAAIGDKVVIFELDKDGKLTEIESADWDTDTVFDVEVSVADETNIIIAGEDGIHTMQFTLDDPEPEKFVPDTVIIGTSKSEKLVGDSRSNQIEGKNGADILKGKDGADLLIGGRGKDKLEGGRGDDMLNGGGKDDKVLGGKGNDTADGGKGKDLVKGGAGADDLSGGKGDDDIQGGKGDDILRDGKGKDVMNGDAGEDVFVLTNDGKRDTIVGWEDGDKIDLSDYGASLATLNYSVELTKKGDLVFRFSGDSLKIDAEKELNLNSLSESDFIFSQRDNSSNMDTMAFKGKQYLVSGVDKAIQKLSGTDKDEKIIGDDSANRIKGKNGEDILIGKGGADFIRGGKGDDRLDGNNGEDRLVGGRGDDRLNGGKADDSLDGGQGNDDLRGNGGNDQIDGGKGNDMLQGGKGADFLNGNNGDDKLFGGNSFDSIEGGRGNDLIEGNGGTDYLSGGSGNDDIRGGKGNDRLFDGKGSDRLFGGAGVDTFVMTKDGARDTIVQWDSLDLLDLTDYGTDFSFDDIIYTDIGNNSIEMNIEGDILIVSNIDNVLYKTPADTDLAFNYFSEENFIFS